MYELDYKSHKIQMPYSKILQVYKTEPIEVKRDWFKYIYTSLLVDSLVLVEANSLFILLNNIELYSK